MKIIHCADIHLESTMKTHFDADTAKIRREEILDTFLRMMEYAGREGVRAVLIAGDLFDKRNVPKRVRSALLGCFEKYSGIDVYYLKGNHDHADTGDGSEDRELPGNLHMFGEEWTEYILEDGGRHRVVLKGAELNKENTQRLHESLYVTQDDINLVMLHGQTSRYMQGDRAEIISLERFKNRGIDYLALGHVHTYGEGELDKRGVWCYPGCLEGRGFDECGAHGFVMLDIDADEAVIDRRFIPFAKRQLHELRVDIGSAGDVTGIEECVRSAWEDAGIPAKDMVKLILTGEVNGELDPDTGLLKQRFEDKAYFLKVKDETAEAIDVSHIAAEKSVRGSYVRLILEDDTVAESEKNALIRTGLLALNKEWDRLEEDWEKLQGGDDE